MNTCLSINLNKIALLRNQRHAGYPCPVAAGRTVLAAGADGLTVHPRPDERHIRTQDVYDLDRMLAQDGHYKRGVEFNIEGNPFETFMQICRNLKPDQATLVPDSPDADTSDSGWDIFATQARLRPLVKELKAMGCRVTLFMDHDSADAMQKVKEIGAERIELYTGPYARHFNKAGEKAILASYKATARAAAAAGLGINAGHDLTIENLPAFKAAIPDLSEVSIGHAFTADALWLGFNGAVNAYLSALNGKKQAA